MEDNIISAHMSVVLKLKYSNGYDKNSACFMSEKSIYMCNWMILNVKYNHWKVVLRLVEGELGKAR